MKNLPVIEVVTETAHMSVTDLVTAATKVHTAGDPIAGAAPVTDANMLLAANKLQTLHNGTLTNPPTVLTDDVNTQINIVVTLYKKNANYIETVANDAAIAAGDVNAGTIVVIRCGYKVKHAKKATAKGFVATSTIANQVDVSTKAVAKSALYIRQFGITATKDIPPTVFEELIISREVNISISNLKSGTIIAFREAYILPIPRRKKTASTTTATAKTATTTSTARGRKALFSYGAEHYNYSGWIYVVVK